MAFSTMRIVGLVQLFTSTCVFALLLYLGRRSRERREALLLSNTGPFFVDIEAQDQQHPRAKTAHPKRREMIDSLDLESDRDEDDDDSTKLHCDILIDNMDLVADLSSSQKHLTPSPPHLSWDANNTKGPVLSSSPSPSETPDGQIEEGRSHPTSLANPNINHLALDDEVDNDIDPDNSPLTTGQRHRSSPAAATAAAATVSSPSAAAAAAATVPSFLVLGSVVDDSIVRTESFVKKRVFI